MRLRHIAAACSIVSIAACRATPARIANSTAAGERTVFTDSLLHVERCESVAPGADWRKVCTPKNQGLQIERKP
jgi:hypothetical protein